jgi:hypothetical protein
MTPLLERQENTVLREVLYSRWPRRTLGCDSRAKANEETSVHGEAAFWGGSLDDSQVGKN